MTESPFGLLGLTPRFDLSNAEIESAYLRRVAAVHPDMLEESDGEASSDLNRARMMLKDPEQRANVLLAALRGPTKEQDRSLPDGFLVQMLETREQIEEAMASGESPRIEEARRWAAGQRASYVARIGAMFDGLSGPSAASLAEIRRELNAWRYIERLIEQLDPAYDPNRADFR